MKFAERYERIEGSSTDIALKLAADGFGVVPGLGWKFLKGGGCRPATRPGDEKGGMKHPLRGMDIMSDWLSDEQDVDAPYYLALGQVGDDEADVLVCVDVDNGHHASPVDFDDLYHAMEKWTEQLGCPEAMDTMVDLTPGAGMHLFFMCEPALGMAWQTGLQCDGLPDACCIDWLAAPGSQHATGPGCKRPTGGEYKLFVPAGSDGLRAAVRRMPTPLLRWLVSTGLEKRSGRVERLFAGGAAGGAAGLKTNFAYQRAIKCADIADIIRVKPRRKSGEEGAPARSAACDEVGQWQVEDAAAAGGRHDALVRFAGQCVHRCTGSDFDTTCDLIRAEVEAFGEHRCEPPLPTPEVASVVRDAMVWAAAARDEIEDRIRHRVVVVDQSGGRSVQVVRDFAERVVNGATYRCKVRRGGQAGVPVCSPTNVVAALEQDDGLRGCFGYDLMACRPVVLKALPWSRPTETFPRFVTDADRSRTISYIDEVAGWNPSRDFQTGFADVCDRHAFNPMQDFVRSLAGKWDGQPHIDRLLSDWMGTTPADDVDGRSFSGEVMRVWMRGAIRRALRPGCKFDIVPILSGPQGCGKTTFFSRLAMRDDLLCESLTDIRDDRKSFEQISGSWLVIIDELAAMRSARDVTRIKTWLTARFDDHRAPYAREQERVPRHVVFAGTTNELSFLSDRSGNRRFAIIPVVGVYDERGLPRLAGDARFEADVMQAWAEAYAAEEAHPDEALVLPQWAVAEQARRNDDASVEDPWTEPVARYLETYRHDCVDEPVSYAQIYASLQDCSQSDYRERVSHLKSFQDSVRRVAEAAGWTYGRFRGTWGDEYGTRTQQRGFMPPALTPDERIALEESKRRLEARFEADEAMWTGEPLLP